jgi:hypothetical protein
MTEYVKRAMTSYVRSEARVKVYEGLGVTMGGRTREGGDDQSCEELSY